MAIAQTVAFVTWLLGHVLLAMNLRSERESIFKLGLFANSFILGWSAAIIAFVLLNALVPAVQAALKTKPLTGKEWTLVVGAALIGSFWIEARKQFVSLRRANW